MLVTAAALVHGTSLLETVLRICGSKQTGAYRDKRVSITPPQGEQTKASDENFFGVIVDLTQKLDILRAVSCVGRVVHDEYVNPLFAGQGSDFVIDDDGGQRTSEAHPVDAGGIDESVEGILGGNRLFLHPECLEQGFMDEDQFKEFSEDVES